MGKTSRVRKKWRISENFNIRSLLSLAHRTPRPFCRSLPPASVRVRPPFLPLSLLFSQVKHEESGRKGEKGRRGQERRRRRHDGSSGLTTALLYLLRLLLPLLREGGEWEREREDGHREGRGQRESAHAMLGGEREERRQKALDVARQRGISIKVVKLGGAGSHRSLAPLFNRRDETWYPLTSVLFLFLLCREPPQVLW